MILRLKWLITRHLLPYGLIAEGKRASIIDDAVASQAQGAYVFWGKGAKWSTCKICGTDLLAWRKLEVCRKFSCYKEVKQSVRNSKPLPEVSQRAAKTKHRR